MIFLFSGCSWQEYFTVFNTTNSEVTVEYEISDVSGGFPIFDHNPSVYQTVRKNQVDWEKKLPVPDEDTSYHGVKIILPPQSALIFGHLSNDHYEKHDQYFINGRSFNLRKLSIHHHRKTVEITPENFDTLFKKLDGHIKYTVE